MGTDLFIEEQSFRQKILWGLLLVITIGSIALFAITYLNSFSSNDESANISLVGLILVTIFTTFLLWFFYRIKLIITIDSNSISYSFWPFIREFKSLKFENINSIYLGKYKPIREYGGWGYRLSLKGRGLCLNVSGNQGMRIKMNDGFELLLGTQKKDELIKTLNQLNLSTVKYEYD